MPFIDPNIARKNTFQNAHLSDAGTLPDGSPVFSEVEFNTSGLCKRKTIRRNPAAGLAILGPDFPVSFYKDFAVSLKKQ